MNATLRASDAERDRTVELLQHAFVDGRIDKADLDRRVESAFSATTRADLAVAMNGLPVAPVETSDVSFSVRQKNSDSRLRQGTSDNARYVPSGGERLAALFTHWLGYTTFFVGPAIVAACASKSSKFLRDQAIEALNFQLTFLGAVIGIVMVAVVTFGIGAIGLPFLLMIWFLLTGVGGLAALVGNRFRYPWILRLVTP